MTVYLIRDNTNNNVVCFGVSTCVEAERRCKSMNDVMKERRFFFTPLYIHIG